VATESRGVEAFLEDKYDGMVRRCTVGDARAAGRVAIYSRTGRM